MAGLGRYPPAWTGYKPSVTIEGTAYEELEYQFVSRRRKLTIHRRLARDDGGLRRRRFSRTLEHIRSSSVKNLKVNTCLLALSARLEFCLSVGGHQGVLLTCKISLQKSLKVSLNVEETSG